MSVAYLPSHRWEPWDCHLHGWHSDNQDVMCPGCEADFIQMGERLADQWDEEEAADRRARIRQDSSTPTQHTLP